MLVVRDRFPSLTPCVCVLLPNATPTGCCWPQVMVADLGLRFLWTASLVPVDSMPLWLAQYMDYWMIAAMEVAELFRRAMWGCVR